MNARTTAAALPRNAALALGMAAAMLLAVVPHKAQADGAPKVIKKVAPDFPPEAARKHITDGVVKARLNIDGAGAVTDVSVTQVSPSNAKVFNEAAVSALSQWRFEPSGKGQSAEITLVFQMD